MSTRQFFKQLKLVRRPLISITASTAEHIQQMFKPIRVVATVVLFASIVLVFIGAFVLGSEVCGERNLEYLLLTAGLIASLHQYVSVSVPHLLSDQNI
jgi:H+/Cl- antiporter ClcA